MLRVSIKRVRPDCVDELRAWMGTVNVQRRDEALATLAEETCTHEQAYLIDAGDGPMLVYVMEVRDVARSVDAARSSSHRIDVDHREVMRRTIGTDVPSELLLDLRP